MTSTVAILPLITYSFPSNGNYYHKYLAVKRRQSRSSSAKSFNTVVKLLINHSTYLSQKCQPPHLCKYWIYRWRLTRIWILSAVVAPHTSSTTDHPLISFMHRYSQVHTYTKSITPRFIISRNAMPRPRCLKRQSIRPHWLPNINR